MTLTRIFAAASAALLLAGTADAQAPAAPNKNPAAVEAGTYQVEPIHTRVLFKVSHLGFSYWYGDFAGVSGTLSLDPKHPAAAQLDVSLPVASVSSVNSKLDDELKGADWLDTAQFPTATFVSRKVTPTGTGHADVTGDLTLHGVTKPLVLHVTFNASGINPMDKAYTAGFEAHGTIQRSAFGVAKYVPLVGDEVELIISGAFERAPSQ